MDTVTIKGKLKNSKIYIDEEITNIFKYIPKDNILIITDKNVDYYYSSFFENYKKIVINSGEDSKSLASVMDIYTEMIKFEVDKSWFILGIGGGVVTDITGFVASTYMRGIRFAYIATSLLGQVDASLGGKNGLNFNTTKNIIGTINQPEFVLCDINLLNTLQTKEIKTGLAEVIKYALISDQNFYQFILENSDKIISLDKNFIKTVILKSVSIKANFVNNDEYDTGNRKKLNFGHTFGHAIEKISDYNHGESVSIGMCLAVKLSVKYNLLPKTKEKNILNLLSVYQLPTSFDLNKNDIIDALKQDKKRISSNINFIFLNSIGQAIIKNIPISDLINFINRY